MSLPRKDRIMTCGTCFYYNGCPHDGMQFCDELEIMRCDTDCSCNKYIKKDCDFDCEKCMSDKEKSSQQSEEKAE